MLGGPARATCVRPTPVRHGVWGSADCTGCSSPVWPVASGRIERVRNDCPSELPVPGEQSTRRSLSRCPWPIPILCRWWAVMRSAKEVVRWHVLDRRSKPRSLTAPQARVRHSSRLARSAERRLRAPPRWGRIGAGHTGSSARPPLRKARAARGGAAAAVAPKEQRPRVARARLAVRASEAAPRARAGPVAVIVAAPQPAPRGMGLIATPCSAPCSRRAYPRATS
jgi:hypothetical protein